MVAEFGVLGPVDRNLVIGVRFRQPYIGFRIDRQVDRVQDAVNREGPVPGDIRA